MSHLALDPASYPAYAAECGDPSRTKVLGFGTRPALLLVDVCEAYFGEASPLCLPADTRASVAGALGALLAAARGGSPVVFAQTRYTHPSLRDAGLLAGKVAPAQAAAFRSDSPLAGPPRAYPALSPMAGSSTVPPLLLCKKYPSPFFGTNLASQLAALGIDTVLIGGCATSGSVRAAALDAMQAGFRPMVVAAACGDRGRETHWANLMDVGAKYGDVVTLEAALDCLESMIDNGMIDNGMIDNGMIDNGNDNGLH